MEVLLKMKQEFIRRFKREPGQGDPIFLAKYLYSEQDLSRESNQLFRAAGVSPAVAYAHRKTGYILTKSNRAFATGAAIQEWEEAIDEYETFGDPADGDSEGAIFDRTLTALLDEIDSLIFLFGLANDNFFNTPALLDHEEELLISPGQYQALCVVRTHRTLRSIKVLLAQHMADDVLKLARSLYENYLHMVYIGSRPERIHDLVDAVIGLRAGSHAYKCTSKGKADKRTIVEIATGKEYLGHISAFSMAQASPIPEDLAFFDFFYETTSQFIHPSIFALDGYLAENGLDPVKSHMYEEGVVFSALVACMVADRIAEIKNCPRQIVKDAAVVVRRTKALLSEILKSLNRWQKRMGANVEEIDILLKRSNCLASKRKRKT